MADDEWWLVITNLGLVHMENDDGEGGEFIVATHADGTDQFVELELFQDLAFLRDTDLDAYELAWEVVSGLLERGAPMESMES